MTDRERAIVSARELLTLRPIILDTETTGLGSDAEICEIAVVSADGNVLMDQRIRPRRPIPADATAIHGITNADVAMKPTFGQIMNGRIRQLMENRDVHIAIFNSEYDLRLIDQSYGPDAPLAIYHRRPNTHCIMNMYAEFYGAWSEYHGSYTWQSLDAAASQCGLEFEGSAHSALADARMTLAVLRHMASTRT